MEITMPPNYEQKLTSIISNIQTKVHSRRILLNFSITDLAEYSGVSGATIRSIETGHTKNPGIDTLIRIAWALGCGEEWIFHE